MRAGLILALVLSVVTPPLPWTAALEGAPKAGATALGSPVSWACALGRNSAKAEKTFAGDWLATPDRQPAHPAGAHAIVRVAPTAPPPHLDLDNPPLAARPPPVA